MGNHFLGVLSAQILREGSAFNTMQIDHWGNLGLKSRNFNKNPPNRRLKGDNPILP
jgi:hypothetical protein